MGWLQTKLSSFVPLLNYLFCKLFKLHHVAEELNHILLKTNLAHGERWEERGWQSGDRDPVSRTNFNKIHASRFESVIVGETSGKRNFHDQTQIIYESCIPHEINHAPHAFRLSLIHI